MRRPIALAVCAVVAGCHSEDVAPPQLHRPIETLPAGAQVVVLASDLANTWQRVESHDMRSLLESMPGAAPALRAPAFARVLELCREFEQATGTSLQDDVLLNVVGGRAGIGVYPHMDADATGGPDHDGDPLMVAELRDPARFESAMAALVARPVADLQVETASFDGDPAWRISRAGEPVLQIVQRQAFVVATTRDDLARAARALHAGGGASALADPALSTALAAVGSHNVTALVRRDDAHWMAHGFTWTSDGLHFDHSSTTGSGEAAGAAQLSHRKAILGSLPDGMTLAAYAHRSVLGEDHRGSDAGLTLHAAGNGIAGLLPFFQLDGAAWCGDEIGIALRGVEPTTLAPVPDAALVIAVRDAAAAQDAMQALEARIVSLPLGPAAAGFIDVQYGGRTFRSLAQPISERVSPSWMLDGDVVVVATTRTLLQQIVDTRRTGRRSVSDDRSFRRFHDFVPDDAGVVVYADQKRLRRAVQELERSAAMWGPRVEQGVLALGRVSTLLEHFPAGAAYATQAGDRIEVRGWMLEAN